MEACFPRRVERIQIVARKSVGSRRQLTLSDPERTYTRGALPKSKTRNSWNCPARSSEQRTSLAVT